MWSLKLVVLAVLCLTGFSAETRGSIAPTVESQERYLDSWRPSRERLQELQKEMPDRSTTPLDLADQNNV